MITTLIVVFGLYLVAMIGFSALSAARRFKRECWNDLPLDWRIALAVVVAIGLLGDFVFNQTRAVVIFGGFSALLFSGRLQRRVDAGKRDALTRRWVRVINTGDSDHVKLPADWPW